VRDVQHKHLTQKIIKKNNNNKSNEKNDYVSQIQRIQKLKATRETNPHRQGVIDQHQSGSKRQSASFVCSERAIQNGGKERWQWKEEQRGENYQ
jgi:hypothetical protein